MSIELPKDVLVFDSSAFPAELANDPDASPSASGEACLARILSLIESPSIWTRTTPHPEGSGFTAYVDVGGISVFIHLTWFPAGPPRAATRDVWTVQAQRARDGVLDLFRDGDKLAADPAAAAVRAAVFDALTSSAEFADVRWCAWKDLET